MERSYRCYDNPSLLISSVFERQREIETLTGSKADPFYLLKEAAEMQLTGPMTMQQEENRENYNAMVNQNYTELKIDPLSIEEKMKKLKFAKRDQSKDTNWFKNIKNSKVGISEEDEKQIQKEMIPMFIQKQQEL